METSRDSRESDDEGGRDSSLPAGSLRRGRRRASGTAGAGLRPVSLLEQPVLHPECGPGVRRSEDVVRLGRAGFAHLGARFGLAGYTLLLATTACFLIRVGKLWDDLRSLLLLIVMMFLAMAISGDDTMAADPHRGQWATSAGLCSRSSLAKSVLRRSGCGSPVGIAPRITRFWP